MADAGRVRGKERERKKERKRTENSRPCAGRESRIPGPAAQSLQPAAGAPLPPCWARLAREGEGKKGGWRESNVGEEKAKEGEMGRGRKDARGMCACVCTEGREERFCVCVCVCVCVQSGEERVVCVCVCVCVCVRLTGHIWLRLSPIPSLLSLPLYLSVSGSMASEKITLNISFEGRQHKVRRPSPFFDLSFFLSFFLLSLSLSLAVAFFASPPFSPVFLSSSSLSPNRLFFYRREQASPSFFVSRPRSTCRRLRRSASSRCTWRSCCSCPRRT